jgi:hypothetical protein
MQAATGSSGENSGMWDSAEALRRGQGPVDAFCCLSNDEIPKPYPALLRIPCTRTPSRPQSGRDAVSDRTRFTSSASMAGAAPPQEFLM